VTGTSSDGEGVGVEVSGDELPADWPDELGDTSGEGELPAGVGCAWAGGDGGAGAGMHAGELGGHVVEPGMHADMEDEARGT
jgi:hypothetical protein